MSGTIGPRPLGELLDAGETPPPAPWEARAIRSDQCHSYVVWNTRSREALLVDPKDTDLDAYREVARQLPGYLWLGVIDTHTHADHVSAAATLAAELSAPLLMHDEAPSRRVDLRVSRATTLASHAGPLRLLPTPGHTPDGIAVLWGPFLFTGDTVLYGDTGRDDLPGGDAETHFESLQALKKFAPPTALMLPGHDHQGRIASWGSQLRTNPSLSQARDAFVAEARAFDGPPPKLLKQALRENFR